MTLDEGGVLLKDVRGKEYPLLPGESAEYNRRSGACQISRPENMEQIILMAFQRFEFLFDSFERDSQGIGTAIRCAFYYTGFSIAG